MTESQSENRKVVKAAGTVGIYTMISRILGFVRDVMLAWAFGSGLHTDAFIAAFRVPNLMRRLFAEGSLVLSFVPIFSDVLQNKGKDEAFRLAASSFRVLSLVLFVLTIAGIAFASYILMALTPGFINDPARMELTVALFRIMFSYVLFISLVALCMGILNAMGNFSTPAVSPVIFNIVVIAGLFAGVLYFDDNTKRVVFLSWSVVAGGIVQLVFQVPALWKEGFRFRIKAPFIHPEVRRIGRNILPSIMGAGVYQVNVVTGTILASFLLEGSISWLYYADRVFQFPLGIFAISLGTAVLPSLSRQTASGDMDGVRNTFTRGLSFVFFVTLPATAGLVALSEPIVSGLFLRGEFGLYDLEMTSVALIFFSLGLCPVSAVRVAAPVFYAEKDTRTPALIAVFSVCFNILASVVLMRPMGHGGLALAASLSSAVNFIMLFIMIRKKICSMNSLFLVISFFRHFACSLIMGICVHRLAVYIFKTYNSSSFSAIFGLFFCIFSGIAIYGLLVFVSGSPEFKEFLTLLKTRKD